MTYIPEESKVVYKSKDAKKEKTFDALEWLAAMASHVPNKGEQMVRYYGYYSNVSRGKREKGDSDERIPSILEPEGSPKEQRKKEVKGTIKESHGVSKVHRIQPWSTEANPVVLLLKHPHRMLLYVMALTGFWVP